MVEDDGGCVGLMGERKREILSNDHLIDDCRDRDSDREYIDNTTKTASTLKCCTRGGYIEIIEVCNSDVSQLQSGGITSRRFRAAANYLIMAFNENLVPVRKNFAPCNTVTSIARSYGIDGIDGIDGVDGVDDIFTQYFWCLL